MKLFTRLLAGLLVTGWLLSPLHAHAQNTQDFTIDSFDADYTLSRDDNGTSRLTVKETIVADFPQFDQNHGILRAIPNSYQQHTVSLSIGGVTDASGTPYNYTTSTSNNNEVLKIGNANSYVHGPTTYVLTYELRNVISFLNDHQEFYWDVNGDQWPQQFTAVNATVHIDPALVSALQPDQVCFAGAAGGKDSSNCTITRSESGDTVNVSTTNLPGYQTLTFVLGFNNGTFKPGPEIAQEKRHHQLIITLFIISFIIPPLWAGTYAYRRWRKFGKDPKGRGVIIPEYLPPKDLSVLASSIVLNERTSAQAVTAEIIAMAVKGYIIIYETSKKKLIGSTKTYELELTKDPSNLTTEQVKLITAIFGSTALGTRINLSSLKNKLFAEISGFDVMVGESLVGQGYFVSSPEKARKTFLVRAGVLLIAGFSVLFTGILIPLGLGLMLGSFILFGFSAIMPARSQQGVEAHDYLLGLKMYMQMAEADRIRYLQSPEGAEKLPTGTNPENQKFKVKLFESLLPYAMLFGIEKEWAKQFKDLYTQPPSWYNGNWSTFNTIYLVNSLGGFGTVTTASFSAPASSSSSGFGGGGFSGGGGGGGGGGGW